MLNDFGYESEYVPSIVDVEDVRKLTGTSAPNEQLEAAVCQVDAIIRHYCGWHVCPPLSCTYETECEGFPEIQLPATHVSKVLSVEVEGEPVEVRWKKNGRIVRKDGKPWPREWGSVVVRYVAGIDQASLASVAAKMAAAAVASPAGVRSESVGSMSVTYATTEAELTERQAAFLGSFRLKARP